MAWSVTVDGGARLVRRFWLLPACLLLSTPLFGQTAENVAVVINESSPDSVRVGEHYARVRGLPAANVLRIRTSAEEAVDRAVYLRTIEQPIGNALARERLQDRVLYLVLTKGVPLRVNGTPGVEGTVASVDSELTLLYRRMTGQQTPPNGSIDNPYFLGDRPLAEARRFSRRDYDIYLVTRLDAFTADEAVALIDRGLSPARAGRIVLDERDALTDRTGEEWLDAAAARLKEQGRGEQLLLDRTPRPVRDVDQVLGYFSWGSTDPQNRVRRTGMRFAPGAIAAFFVGSDARTFRAPPDTWTPSENPPDRSSWYAGSPESLVGDVIREGVTGVAGSVAEAFLFGSLRPQVLLPAYLSGMNLAESFYLATPRLSWRTIVVGDPLVAVAPNKPLTRQQIENGVHELTQLPGFLGPRLMQWAVRQFPGVPERALGLNVRASAMLTAGDQRGARALLEEAVKLAPTFTVPLLQLAMMDERAGNFQSAIVRYQRLVELQPKNPVVLNNLAYSMAVHANMPAEALPFARRAAAVTPRDPNILDTLAWVLHLNGNNADASKVMSDAMKLGPNVPVIHLHAAAIFADAGARAAADTALKRALALDASLEKSDEVRAVRQKLQETGGRAQ